MKDKEASAPGLSDDDIESEWRMSVGRLWPRSTTPVTASDLVKFAKGILPRASAATVGEAGDDFRRGVRAAFDHLMYAACNTDDQDKSNILMDAAKDLIEEISPEDGNAWKAIGKAHQEGIAEGKRQAAQQQPEHEDWSTPERAYPANLQLKAEPGADERAAFWQEDDNGLLSRVPESITQAINEEDVPIGYAGAMPYCDDWTQAVFEADKVPEGTPLYLKTAQSGQRAGVAEGHVVVPVVPTEAMLRAMTDGFIAVNGSNREEFARAYPRMLAAAPTQQQDGE